MENVIWFFYVFIAIVVGIAMLLILKGTIIPIFWIMSSYSIVFLILVPHFFWRVNHFWSAVSVEEIWFNLRLILLGVGFFVEYVVLLVKSVRVILFFIKVTLGLIILMSFWAIVFINVLSKFISIASHARADAEWMILICHEIIVLSYFLHYVSNILFCLYLLINIY
jgi:hypothetical protein